MSAYETIRFQAADGITRITLDRPEKLNSFTAVMRAELIDALSRVADDPTVRCLLLDGAGRAFSAGQDLDEREPVVRGERIDLGDQLETGFNRIVRSIRSLPVPVVCAVRGAAAGAGANLALACDIVLAARSARFIQTFSHIGLIPDGGGSWVLPRLAGMAKAKGLALLGEPVDGEEAERLGLVWKCVDDDALDDVAMEIARSLAKRSQHALSMTKHALQAAMSNDLDTQLDLERDLQRQAGFTPEYRQAVTDFLARRRKS